MELVSGANLGAVLVFYLLLAQPHYDAVLLARSNNVFSEQPIMSILNNTCFFCSIRQIVYYTIYVKTSIIKGAGHD